MSSVMLLLQWIFKEEVGKRTKRCTPSTTSVGMQKRRYEVYVTRKLFFSTHTTELSTQIHSDDTINLSSKKLGKQFTAYVPFLILPYSQLRKL